MNFRSANVFRYYLWVGVALALIFTVLKPAGTEGAGLPARLLIWSVNIGVLLVLLIALHMILQSRNSFNHLNPWLKLTLSGIAGSVLFVPAGLGIDYLFGLDDWSAVNSAADAVPFIIQEFNGVLFPVTLTWIAINAPRILQFDFKQLDLKEMNTTVSGDFGGVLESHSPANDFMSLIPANLGIDIIYLKSELHYVRVVTNRGETLLLFNLKDAIADLEFVAEGIQTHRSYWVSGRHLKELITEKDRTYAITTGHHEIPVSRRRSADVKQFVKNSGIPVKRNRQGVGMR